MIFKYFNDIEDYILNIKSSNKIRHQWNQIYVWTDVYMIYSMDMIIGYVKF